MDAKKKTLNSMMKPLTVAVAISCIIVSQELRAEPPTFDQFKSLSQEQRKTAIDSADRELKNKLLDLDHRVQVYENIGEEDWTRLLQEYAIVARGFPGLSNLFLVHREVRNAYLIQECGTITGTGEAAIQQERNFKKQEERLLLDYQKAIK